jgi:hypothetical protein
MTRRAIAPIVLERREPRDDVRLTSAWVHLPIPSSLFSFGGWLHRGTVPPPPATQGPMLVLYGSSGTGSVAPLVSLTRLGARTYALVGPTWGHGAESELAAVPNLLVRRLPELPATAMLVGPEARLWVGGGYSMRLDEAQASALRQVFLRHFWHEATEEGWSKGRSFSWRAAAARPFDVPELPANSPLRWERPDAHLSVELRDSLVHLPGGSPPEALPRRLWFPAGPDHQERLGRLVEAGAEVRWEDRGLPEMVLSGDTGEVLLPGQRGRLRIRLNPGQTADLSLLLQAEAPWRYQNRVRLGDPAHRTASFWLPGFQKAAPLEAEQVISLAELPAQSLRAMSETTPGTFPPGQPLALALRYRWTVLPPRAPAGTDEDALVARWRKLDEDWAARLAQLKEQLSAAEGNRSRIARAFGRLASAVLGFQRTQSGLFAQIAELDGQRPSLAGPSGAPALLSRLAGVEESTRKLQSELDESERKARDDEEREKQEKAWMSRVETAKRELTDRRPALVSAESRRGDIGRELGTLEADLKVADKDNRKDLTTRQRKLSDDLARATKEIDRLRGEIKALEQQETERFEYRPPPTPPTRPVQPGGRFVPTTPSSPRPSTVVPEEALPEVGQLRVQKGQRYLIIQDWDELSAGEQAAARLSARLVAPEKP